MWCVKVVKTPGGEFMVKCARRSWTRTSVGSQLLEVGEYLGTVGICPLTSRISNIIYLMRNVKWETTTQEQPIRFFHLEPKSGLKISGCKWKKKTWWFPTFFFSCLKSSELNVSNSAIGDEKKSIPGFKWYNHTGLFSSMDSSCFYVTITQQPNCFCNGNHGKE